MSLNNFRTTRSLGVLDFEQKDQTYKLRLDSEREFAARFKINFGGERELVRNRFIGKFPEGDVLDPNSESRVVDDKVELRFSGNRSSTGVMFRINGRYSEFTKHPGGADANFSINYDYSSTGHLKFFAFAAKNEIGVKVDQPSFDGIFNSDDLNQLYKLSIILT